MVRGQWVNLVRMPGLNPYSFPKDMEIQYIFNK